MTTRTLHDADDTEWTLARALVGTDDEREDTDHEGTVPVVATPSGGAQSVRLELDPDWAPADESVSLSAFAQAS